MRTRWASSSAGLAARTCSAAATASSVAPRSTCSCASRRSTCSRSSVSCPRRPSAQRAYRSSGSISPVNRSRALVSSSTPPSARAVRADASASSASIHTVAGPRRRSVPSEIRYEEVARGANSGSRARRAACRATRRLPAAAFGSASGQQMSMACSRWSRCPGTTARSFTRALAPGRGHRSASAGPPSRVTLKPPKRCRRSNGAAAVLPSGRCASMEAHFNRTC